jgi:WXG100 family type VII secretion target
VAASDRFRLDLDALGSSATHVTGQGEDLATAHMSSDNRLVAAQSGWAGSSSAALHAKTAEWLETSRRLVTSIGDHATDLNQDGIDFSAMERDHTEKLQALHPAPEGLTGSV